jgi:hypothetical protein
VQSSGEVIHDPNVVVMTPNPKPSGYVAPKDLVAATHTSGVGTGSASYAVLDPTAVTTHKYRVEFLDTQVDNVDNNKNGLVDAADSTEWDRRTSFYAVLDLEPRSETFVSDDTLVVKLQHSHLVSSSVQVRTSNGAIVAPSAYLFDADRGVIRGSSVGSLPARQTFTITYQYYPVFESPNIQNSPFLTDSRDADVFDGIEMVFNNDWSVVVDTARGPVGWSGKKYLTWSVGPLSANDPLSHKPLRGYRRPCDYRIEFANTVVDTALEDIPYGTFSTPVKFRVFNVTDNTYIKFLFNDLDLSGDLTPIDEIVFMDRDPRGLLHYSWVVSFPNFATTDSLSRPGAGDQFIVKMKKSFQQGDVFEFTTERPHVDQQAAKDLLHRVRAVPNPYVTASSFELPLNPGITSGRGTRKIEFIHVPVGASIRIFTARGDHVITLHQDGNIEDGTVSWNLKTSENLDVAYGVYFYVVESPAGTSTGKLAIIK